MGHALDDILILAKKYAGRYAYQALASFADKFQHILKALHPVAFHDLFGTAAIHHAGNMGQKSIITFFHRRGEVRLIHHALVP